MTITYMKDYVLILGKGNQQGPESFRRTGVKSACGWKGRPYTAMLQRNKMGITTLGFVSRSLSFITIQSSCLYVGKRKRSLYRSGVKKKNV